MTRLQSHCSGHSKGSYLLEVVKTIDSDMLYPIHTEHPDAYKKVTDKLTIVQEGKKYELQRVITSWQRKKNKKISDAVSLEKMTKNSTTNLPESAQERNETNFIKQAECTPIGPQGSLNIYLLININSLKCPFLQIIT